MSKTLSIKKFSTLIQDWIEAISTVRKEIEEIQVGFNSRYVEWKVEHDAKLESLTNRIIDDRESAGESLQATISERIIEEKQIIEARREELGEQLIPNKRDEGDGVLAEAKSLTNRLRRLNPELDAREEKLKAQQITLEAMLGKFNKRIRRLSGCLGVVFNFRKIRNLDKKRQRVIGKLETIHAELKELREEWVKTKNEVGTDQATLQSWWQASAVELSKFQGELDYLDDPISRESLALRRAVRHSIDNLKTAVTCQTKELQTSIDRMIELNIQTDSFQDGLGSVGSTISVLDGVLDGLARFNESVDGLIKEQDMHSAYLAKLKIKVSDEVEGFHGQWGGLQQMITDEARLTKNPEEFMAIVDPIMQGELSQENIKRSFENLGTALNIATEVWKK